MTAATRHPGEAELRALMLAGLEGDSRSYRRLLELVQGRLAVFFARRLAGARDEVDDLVQETLIALHSKRATYDAAQPVTAWVYAIARYKLIDLYRRTGRRKYVPIDLVESELWVGDEGEAVGARLDVEAGLAELPERARDLVRRVKLEGEPVAEVAARAGMSESAVKVAVHRAFTRLADRLRGPDGEPPRKPPD